MIENCSVIFYARDGCERFYTAKVKSDKAQIEQMLSALPPITDIGMVTLIANLLPPFPVARDVRYRR